MTSQDNDQWFNMRPYCPRLCLTPRPTRNGYPKRRPIGISYTITIDSSADSITIGISAEDRNLICLTLGSPHTRVNSFERPGHIIPLTVRLASVRQRRGHNEAAADVCRLAGKAPAGVITELIECGEIVEGVPEVGGQSGMMRWDGCLRFGKRWGIDIRTIDDLLT